MKLAVISDIHDNIPNLSKCFNFCRENMINTAICCGDVTNSETLKLIAKFFSNRLFLAGGNMEIYDESEAVIYKNISYLGRRGGIAEFSGKRFGICHEPSYISGILKRCEKSVGCNIIFYGHTHKPWEYERNGIKIINPGTVAGTFSQPTFATWEIDNGKIDLKLINLIK